MEPALVEREGLYMTVNGKKIYTVADIETLPEGERAELIDGEMFMMAAPALIHQDMLLWLTVRIGSYVMAHKGPCKVVPAPFAVYVKDDEYNYVEPDIAVICDRIRLNERGCHGAPDWVIEIVSSSSKTMDYVRKLVLYRETGVREYWIVDPVQESITVYELEHGREPVLHSFNDRIKAGIYEDFFLDFSEFKQYREM